MATLIVSIVTLVVVLAVAYVLKRKLDQVIKKVDDHAAFVARQDEERRRTKCGGLFARLLRMLDKEGVDLRFSRNSANLMSIWNGNASITVQVREHMGAEETGQLIAFGDGYPTINSCEHDIHTFARQIKQALFYLNKVRSA